MTDEYEHPYFDHRLDGINYSIASVGITAEEVAESFKLFGRAVGKFQGELSREEKSALFEDALPYKDAEIGCSYCACEYTRVNVRGAVICSGCGAPKENQDDR